MNSGKNTESNRSGDELFEIVRFDLTKPFGEIVNQHNGYYTSAKDSFLLNTEDILSYGGATLQGQVTKEINAIEEAFLNDEAQKDSYTILGFPEATPLLKLGFYHFREDPRISFYHLVQNLPSLIPLGSLDRMPTKLIEVDPKYLNMRYTDLSANELLIEALEYVVIGGNMALLYSYLISIRNNDKPSPAIKKQGQEYRVLKDIFISDDAFNEAVNALKVVEPPVISDLKEYLLSPRRKGAVVAWVEILKKRGKVKAVSNIVMTTLINQEIKGLDLYKDGSTLGDVGTSAYKKYYGSFAKLI